MRSYSKLILDRDPVRFSKSQTSLSILCLRSTFRETRIGMTQTSIVLDATLVRRPVHSGKIFAS